MLSTNPKFNVKHINLPLVSIVKSINCYSRETEKLRLYLRTINYVFTVSFCFVFVSFFFNLDFV